MDSNIIETLEYNDKIITEFIVSVLLRIRLFRLLKRHCWIFEISCKVTTWLAGLQTLSWIINDSSFDNTKINLLMGLLIDIVIVAVANALTRRRRPRSGDGSYVIGPDKFSFPCGHSSRAFFLIGFFTMLHPLPLMKSALVIWASCVCVSRLLMYRHHLFDVVGGILFGGIDTLLLYNLWLGPELTKSFISGGYDPNSNETGLLNHLFAIIRDILVWFLLVIYNIFRIFE